MRLAGPILRLSAGPDYHTWVRDARDGDQAELRSDEVRAIAAVQRNWGWVRTFSVVDEHGVPRTWVERMRGRRS